MHIAWRSLGEVLLVGLVAGAGLVILYTVAVVGLSRIAVARETGHTDLWGAGLAAVCFLGCAAGVLYGIYLIVPQFH
jgi:hypothetical protein